MSRHAVSKGRRSDRAPAGRLPGRLVAVPHLPSSGAPDESRHGGGEVRSALLILGFLALAVGAAADPSPVVAISSRFGWAQGCAIGPDLILTAAHVLDVEPKNPNVPAFPGRFESEDGTVGTLRPIAIDQASDIALARTSVPLKHHRTLAAEAPEIGAELHWVGFDWGKRSNAAKRKRFSGRLMRIVAGQLWFDEETPAGTSGSCVMTDDGAVVGIISAGLGTEDQREATIAVAVFGPWRDEVERLLAKTIKPEEKPE